MKKEYIIGLLLAIGYLAILIATLPDYGMTWDESENFITGEVYLNFFQTFNKLYLQFNGDNPLFYYKPELLKLYSEKINLLYPPFANILSAATSSIIKGDLIFGYHLIIPVFASLLVFVTFIFSNRYFGLRIAVISSMFLGLMPHFFGHAHNNIKDIPLATMYFLAFYFMYKLYLNLNWKNICLAGVSFGLALLTKINAVFLLISFGIFIWFVHGKNIASYFTKQQKAIIKNASLFIVILGFFLLMFTFISQDVLKEYGKSVIISQYNSGKCCQGKGLEYWVNHIDNVFEGKFSQFTGSILALISFLLLVNIVLIKSKNSLKFDSTASYQKNKKYLVYLMGFSFIALSVFYLFWPYLWFNPISGLIKMFSHFSSVWKGGPVLFFGHTYKAGITTPFYYAAIYLLITLPLHYLIFFFGGIGILFNRNRRLFLLISIIISVTLFKYVFNLVIYDGIRHIMEVLPFIAIITGIGIDAFLKKFKDSLVFILLAILLILSVLPIIQYHPYQTSYFNALSQINGKSANENFDVEYWGHSLKEGSEWLNGYITKNTTIISPFANHLAKFYLAPEFDLIYSNKKEIMLNESLYPLCVIFPNRKSFFGKNDSLINALKTLKVQPTYTIRRMDAKILMVYCFEQLN